MFKYFQLKCIFRMCLMLEIAEIKFWFNDLIWFPYIFRTYIQKYVVENEIEEKIKYIFALIKKKKNLQSFQEKFFYTKCLFFPISFLNPFYVHSTFLLVFFYSVRFEFPSVINFVVAEQNTILFFFFFYKIKLKFFTLNFKNNKLSVNFVSKK